eukprot:COSAG04_NODE_6000_length_1437_cov_1.401345_2_plen_245_part_01
MFEADGKPQNITCDGLACYAAPNADLSVARALNENAIVYDGKLVVNAIFQSNDPAVMAAGSVTKFSRRYGAQLPVSCYNSREVGAALGRTVLDVAMFDGANLDPDTCPTFSQAKAKGCMLPSGLQYFHTARPGRGSAPGEGRDLVTEGTAPDGSVRFCCVHVDKFDVVESISYLGAPQSPISVCDQSHDMPTDWMVGCGAGRESLEWANLMKLIGLPQGYLNRLVTHFDEGLVDLPTWFRQPWSM